MRPVGVGVLLCGLMLMVRTAPAVDTPELSALKQLVRALKAQKEATLKALRAQYDSVINQTKRSEADIGATRKALAAQEEELKSLGDSAESKKMKENAALLRQALLGETKLDAAQIAALRVQKNEQIKFIAAAYDAKIKPIEAAIAQAPKSPAQPKRK